MDTNLDDELLKQFGGLKTNDLNSILHTFQDSEDEITTMQHSHYYDWELRATRYDNIK